MRRTRVMSAVVLVAGLVSACGDAPSADTGKEVPRGPAPEVAAALAAIDLPVVRTVGLPPDAATRFDVVVTADGSLFVGGAPGDLRTLSAALAAHEVGLADGALLDLDVVITADRSVPWRIVQIVLSESAMHQVQRVYYAVRHEGGGEPGAMAVFFPYDVEARPPVQIQPPIVAVRVRPDGDASDPRGLETVIGTLPREPRAVVEIDAGPTTPFEVVLGIVDAAAVGGAGEVRFIGTPYDRETVDLVAETTDLRAAPEARRISTRGAEWPGAPAPVDVPRVTDGAAGFVHSESLYDEQPPDLVEEQR